MFKNYYLILKVQTIIIMKASQQLKKTQYNIIKILGQGAFAIVYQALDNNNNRVAIKAIKVGELNRVAKLKQLVKTQISVLKGCNNENVIKYVDSFQTNEFLYIVTEYCNGGDLQKYIKNNNILEDEALEFLKQILNGFKGLHEIGAMHRDFKAANVLIHDGVCKIADLGFAKQMPETSIAKTILGTSITMAPEVLSQVPYGFQADIWSIGVVFYQMLYGKYPYNGKNDWQLLKNIKNQKPKYDQINLSKQSLDFLQKCLTVDPKKRINWKQIYDHPLITKEEGIIVSSGILRPKCDLKTNKQFYEKNNLPSKNTLEEKISFGKTIKIKFLEQEKFKMSEISNALRDNQYKKRAQQQTIQKFDLLFLEKRNDLMFFQKFIQPYLPNLQQMKINHSIACFIMSKKCCITLKQLSKYMQKQSNPFPKQEGFEIYIKTDNFQKVKKLLTEDLMKMQKICKTYKQNIKISSLQIQSQFFDLTKSKNPSYNTLMNQIIGQYLRLLCQSACFIKEEGKNDLIRVVQALKYLYNNTNPHTYEFDRLIKTADFAKIERNLIKRIS